MEMVHSVLSFLSDPVGAIPKKRRMSFDCGRWDSYVSEGFGCLTVTVSICYLYHSQDTTGTLYNNLHTLLCHTLFQIGNHNN